MTKAIDLKLFRFKHDQMHQKTLGEIIGVKQSTLSRMEAMHSEIEDWQYKRLVEEFGEEDVKQYIVQNPNIKTSPKRRRYEPIDDDTMQNVLKTLSSTISYLQTENERLRKENEQLRENIKNNLV